MKDRGRMRLMGKRTIGSLAGGETEGGREKGGRGRGVGGGPWRPEELLEQHSARNGYTHATGTCSLAVEPSYA